MDNQQLIEEIKRQAIRLDNYDDLDAIVEAVGDAKYVLLGEASHGTSEFYTMRAELSKRLIEKKGFSFIGVEGDWPSCYSVNRFIKGYEGAAGTARDAVKDFGRWPTWMWANQEVIELAEWMQAYNRDRAAEQRVGFYGIDVYSLWESMDEIIRYLTDKGYTHELETARNAFACFEPFSRSEQTYGISASFLGESCEEEVVKLLMELQMKRSTQIHNNDREDALSAEINALVMVDAERYYRAMVHGGPESWNIRDHHMVETVHRLADFHGTNAKAIIWEHNTHIGDARATDMLGDGMVNVGQLMREQRPGQVYAVGFGTHRGTVCAAHAWGEKMEVMKVPNAQKDSWEDLMHQAGNYDQILFLGQENLPFHQVVGHRAIGVVYHPGREKWGNYVPSNMAERYDAFVFIDETKALNPIEVPTLYR